MIILIHTSKTMRLDAAGAAPTRSDPLTTPALVDRSRVLVEYLRTLSTAEIAKAMSVSEPLAEKTREQYATWNTDQAGQTAAVESFLGDIYSGLQADTFTADDRVYASAHLRILSGLYGILRPYDGVRPYRLEMGYRLPDSRYANLYSYWGTTVVGQLPSTGPVVNLTANEYSRVVLGHLDRSRVVSPRFLTVDPVSGEPRFVVVHAKIARGAYARWLVTTRASGTDALTGFADLGYRHEAALSTPAEPCFVCAEFGGKGLSVRQTTSTSTASPASRRGPAAKATRPARRSANAN